MVSNDAAVSVSEGPRLGQSRRPQAGRGARRLRDRSGRASSRSTSARPPAASRTCCSIAARRACTRSTSAMASSPSGSARTRGSCRWSGSTRGRSHRGVLPEAVDLAVVDVSFISLRLVLDPIRSVLRDGRGPIVALVKPQFEAGRAEAKGGVVRDAVGPPPGHRRGCGERRGAGARDARRHRVADPGSRGQPRVPRPPPGRAVVRRGGGADRRGGRGGLGRRPRRRGDAGDRARDHPPHRVRLQPDHRAGDRAERARGRLVPDARRRALGDRGGRDRGAVRATPGDRRAGRARRRRDVPARRPGRDRRRRADPGHQPRADRVPLEGGDRRARIGARDAPGRRLRAATADGPRRARSCPPGGPRSGPSRPSTTSSSRAGRSPGWSGWTASIDESHLATFVADGLVVSSPTGSTGYSFSAGGPILDPHSRNLVVTPIAGYLSAIRSIVVSPHQVVRCTDPRRPRGPGLDRRPRGPPDRGRRRGRGAGARAADPVRRAVRQHAVLGPAADEGPAAAVVTTPETGSGGAGRLLELAVDDLALIDRLRLSLAAGPQRADRGDRRRQEPADRRPAASRWARAPTRRWSGTGRRARGWRRCSTGCRSR